MRVLDSFGTDAEFNYKHYKGKIPGGRSPWGDIDLQLRQFMTMYRKYRKKDLKVLKVQKVLTTTLYWKGLAGVPALGTSAPTLNNVGCYCEIKVRINRQLFPVAHSPDNSFLGFAVPQRERKDKGPLQKTNTRKAALVYGKDPQFWEVRLTPLITMTISSFSSSGSLETLSRIKVCHEIIFPFFSTSLGAWRLH